MNHNEQRLNATSPQIENQLDRLAEICCRSIKGEIPLDFIECEALLKALLMNGYGRNSGSTLSSDLEERCNAKWSEPLIQRAGELSVLTYQLQKRFEDFARWEAHRPLD